MILSFVMVLSLATFSYGVAGGDFASRGEFPHAVQLSSVPTGKFFCGGNIIHPSVILTAAHCLEENSTRRAAHEIQVTAGSVRKGTTKEEDGVQLCSVVHYIVHPAYKTWENHDIALLFLTKPLNFSETVAPIQLPSNSSETYSTGVFSGWGDTGWYFHPAPSPSYLKKINMNFSERQTCDQKLSSYSSSRVADNQFCTIFSSGSGICYGDSGGSVVCEESGITGNASTPVLCGIGSWALTTCGLFITVTVFTDVFKYLDWIQDTIEMEYGLTWNVFNKWFWLISIAILGLILGMIFYLKRKIAKPVHYLV